MRLGERVEAIFSFENSACWPSIPKPVLFAQGHRMSLKSALGECSGATLPPRAVQAQRALCVCHLQELEVTTSQQNGKCSS